MWRIMVADDTRQTKWKGSILTGCKGEHSIVCQSPNWKTRISLFREEQEYIPKGHTLHHILIIVCYVSWLNTNKPSLTENEIHMTQTQVGHHASNAEYSHSSVVRIIDYANIIVQIRTMFRSLSIVLFLGKTQRFGDWILSPSSGKTYSVWPNRNVVFK
jgi:hypothetical protein